jgi:hypothetical protein
MTVKRKGAIAQRPFDYLTNKTPLWRWTPEKSQLSIVVQVNATCFHFLSFFLDFIGQHVVLSATCEMEQLL